MQLLIFELTPEMRNVRNGAVFEAFVVLAIFSMLIAIALRYKRKPSELTKILFIVHVSYFIAVLFSWLAKILYLAHNITSLTDMALDTPGYWFYSLVFKYRVCFAGFAMGGYFTYKFKERVFEKKINMKHHRIVQFSTFGVIFFNLFITSNESSMLDLIAFGLMFLLVVMIYIPLISQTLKLLPKIDEEMYQRGLKALGWMGICFIGISVNMILDRAMIILFDSDGYTFFYYLGWLCSIFGSVAAYNGFIKPSSNN